MIFFLFLFNSYEIDFDTKYVIAVTTVPSAHLKFLAHEKRGRLDDGTF